MTDLDDYGHEIEEETYEQRFGEALEYVELMERLREEFPRRKKTPGGNRGGKE